jgi:hypothetical protein
VLRLDAQAVARLAPERDLAVMSQHPANHANTLASLRFSERAAYKGPLVFWRNPTFMQGRSLSLGRIPVGASPVI